MCATARTKSLCCSGSRFASAARRAGPSFSNRSASATSRSAFAWKTGRTYALGDARDGAQHALLAAAGAGAVARDQRVVVAPDPSSGCAASPSSSRSGSRGCRARGTSATCPAADRGNAVPVSWSAFTCSVSWDHPERVVVAAGGDARRAALAQVRDEDGEDAAAARALPFGRLEDGVHARVRQGLLLDDIEELRLGGLREAVDAVGDVADDLRQRRLVLRGDRGLHPLAASAPRSPAPWRACSPAHRRR